MSFLDRDLVEEVRVLVLGVIARGAELVRIQPLQVRADAAVLLVTITDGRRLVVKLSGPQAEDPVRFERTAMLTRLARATGVPVPEVLVADDSCTSHRWRYLVAEHIEGIPWCEVAPTLAADQVAGVHQQLAVALLAVQTTSFAGFGELDRWGQPPAEQNVLAALHQRAALRVRDLAARTAFQRLLDREAALFSAQEVATLSHDDLHHGNVLVRPDGNRWRLVAVLDWDKAWAGPVESDPARMAFWDDMTGPAFWEVYRAGTVPSEDTAERTLIYQLLWCLEYDDGSSRHAADTARLRRRLAVA